MSTGKAGVDKITDLVNQIIVKAAFLAVWERSAVANCYKGKLDA